MQTRNNRVQLKIGQVNRYKIQSEQDDQYIVHDIKNNRYPLYKRFCYKKKFVKNQFIFLHAFEDRDGERYLSVKLPILKENEIGVLRVLSVDEKGFFLDNGIERDVFLPIEEKRVFLEVGGTALVKVFNETESLQRATMKFNFKHVKPGEIKLGSRIKARMLNEICTEEGRLTGIRLLSDSAIAVYVNKADISRLPRINERLELRITKYRHDGCLNGSMREEAKQRRIDDTKLILNYIIDNNGVISVTDKSSPERIKETFAMSKKSFKKAISILIASRKIRLKDNKYYLIES